MQMPNWPFLIIGFHQVPLQQGQQQNPPLVTFTTTTTALLKTCTFTRDGFFFHSMPHEDAKNLLSESWNEKNQDFAK